MGKKRKKSKPDTKQSILFLIVLGVVLSCAAMYSFLTTDDTDSQIVNGTFNLFEQKKHRVSRTTKTYYDIYVDGVQYKIPNIYRSALNKEQFINEVQSGDEITLVIRDDNHIYQITKDQTDYIDSEKLQEEIEDNQTAGLIVGCFFIGCTLYLIRMYRRL